MKYKFHHILWGLLCMLFLFQSKPLSAYHEVSVSLQGKGYVYSPTSYTHFECPANVQIVIKWTSTPLNAADLKNTLSSALSPYLTSISYTDIPGGLTSFSMQLITDGKESLALTFSQGVATSSFTFYFDRPEDYTSPSSNWIRTRTYTGTGGTDYVHDISYFDGLGLPEQEVSPADSPAGGSIIKPFFKDSLLRTDTRAYLPYAISSKSGKKVTAATASSRYQALYGAEDADYPFGEQRYDGYASGRINAEFLPGKVFRDEDKHIRYTHGANSASASVLLLKLSADRQTMTVSSSPYANNALHRDTKYSADGKRHDTYKDKRGKVILERDWTGTSTYADTYYVYDINDRLSWVISPEGTNLLLPGATLPDSTFASKWATAYQYDDQNRTSGKRRPGCGWEYSVYDKDGRLVLQQDSTLRRNNRWIYYIYDNLGRQINRTVVSSTLTRDEIQSRYDASTFDNTYPALGGATDWRVPISTSLFTFVQELEAVRYGCDHYRIGTTHTGTAKFTLPYSLYFIPATGVAESADVDTTTRNMKIYEKEAILGSAVANITGGRTYIERAFHYDKNGRIIQTVEKNVLGGTSRTSVKYDYQGHPLIIEERHRTSSSDTSDDIKRTEYTYDQRGRILSETVTLNGGTPATVTYAYDDVGRHTGAIYGNGVSDLQTNTTQGWLKSLTTISTSSTDPLLTLGYDYWDTTASTSLYDGDISAIHWTNGEEERTHAFTYDRMGRLNGAVQPGFQALSESGITYDRNGNILTLTRNDGSGNPLHDLTFTYDGDQLATLTSSETQYTYTYDGDGQLSTDTRKNNAITYNVLHLPDQIMSASNPSQINGGFLYLADGTKIGIFMNTSPLYIGRLTLGSLVYDKSTSITLESTDFAAGRVFASASGVGTGVRYYSRDHLGSTRLITDENGAVVERSDYYPFGLRMEGGIQASGNRWRFAGKEEQQDFIANLEWLDFGARMYDPFLARWTTQDPLAEKYYSISPYAYCANNPVNLVDPEGKYLRILYYDGEKKVFTYTGKETDIPNNSYVHAVIDAYQYNKHNWEMAGNKGVSPSTLLVERMDYYVYIKEQFGEESQYKRENGGIPYIIWNPYEGMKTDHGIILSPATILAHEADHANSDLDDTVTHSFRHEAIDSDYETKEERRVIEGTEQMTAKANGEISRRQVTRRNHKGKTVYTISPISTFVDNSVKYYLMNKRRK